MVTFGPDRRGRGTRRAAGPRTAGPRAVGRRAVVRARRGFALILAVLVVAALGTFVIALDLLLRGGGAGVAAEKHITRASLAAMSGIARALDEWPRAWRLAAAPAGFDVSGDPTYRRIYYVGTDTVVVRVTREDSVRYVFTATAGHTGATVTRRVSAVRRAFVLPPAVVNAPTQNVYLQPGTTIDGRDTPTPSGADCPPLGAAVPGVLTPAATPLATDQATFLPAGGTLRVYSPTLATPAALSQYGLLGKADLPGLATRTYTSATFGASDVASACTGSGAAGSPFTCAGWGNPLATAADPAAGQVPVIYTSGNLVLQNAGSVQALVVVSGTLQLVGNTKLYGVALVEGWVNLLPDPMTGAAPEIVGKVVLTGPNSGLNLNAGAIRHSSCAIAQVNRARAISRPVPMRPLTDIVFGTGER